jgi:hypothetical protein
MKLQQLLLAILFLAVGDVVVGSFFRENERM